MYFIMLNCGEGQVFNDRVFSLQKIRDNHFNASEEFKSEQAKAGDVEHTLRASIQRLQQQIKDQTRTKVTYSVTNIIQ